MQKTWRIRDIDPKKLIEVLPNRDPETSMRFSLPVPNWLDEGGAPKFDHPALHQVEKKGKKEWRFRFHNYEDGCEQAVKVDGTGSVIFMSPTPGQAQALTQIVYAQTADLDQMKPEHLESILASAYGKVGLLDRYHENRSVIRSKMDIHDPQPGQHPDFGGFLFKATASTCVFLSGHGQFSDGPSSTPQTFENGAFILFPSQSPEQVRSIIAAHNTDEPQERPSVKLVSKAAFLKSRRDLSGKPLDMTQIPVQDEPFRRIYKPKPISGFTEWTPEVRDTEREWLRRIEGTYELYGFTNIETPAAEEVNVLLAKGEDTDKEMYGLHRMQAEQDRPHEPKIGLHYDLTVPLARYVAQHYSEIDFPFKRYQIQKVWRGSRPQKGRFREFTQCDIDVVDQDKLSLEFDAEMPVMFSSLLEKLEVDNVVIGVNNRKILEGFYQGLGLEQEQIKKAIRVVDKLDKIGADGVSSILKEELGLPQETVEKCIALAQVRETTASVMQRVLALGVDTPLLRTGLEELDFVMDRIQSRPGGTVVRADLSIARGFDYYTGTVYEGRFSDAPDYPAILAGGRYDNLVGSFMNKSMPGVGMSLGLTRIFSKLVQDGKISGGRKTPTQVLVTMTSDGERAAARQIADDLRHRGIAAEVFHTPEKLGKQFRYASKKDIPYAVIVQGVETSQYQLKNLSTGDQTLVQANAITKDMLYKKAI